MKMHSIPPKYWINIPEDGQTMTQTCCTNTISVSKCIALTLLIINKNQLLKSQQEVAQKKDSKHDTNYKRAYIFRHYFLFILWKCFKFIYHYPTDTGKVPCILNVKWHMLTATRKYLWFHCCVVTLVTVFNTVQPCTHQNPFSEKHVWKIY
jgi:hypothetical protein